jgi:hypothetical protein
MLHTYPSDHRRGAEKIFRHDGEGWLSESEVSKVNCFAAAMHLLPAQESMGQAYKNFRSAAPLFPGLAQPQFFRQPFTTVVT